MRQVNKFWLYGNKYGIMDSFCTVWSIGEKDDIIEQCDKMNKDKSLSYYAPFEVVKLTDEGSQVFEAK